MNAAIAALKRELTKAQASLQRAEVEQRDASYTGAIRHVIREYEQGLYWLKWANEERLRWVRVWNAGAGGNGA